MLTDEQFARRIKDFLSSVQRGEPGECWPATKAKIYWSPGVYKRGTHIAYWLEHRRWLDYVEHTCDNPPCRNPAHLVGSDHGRNMHSMVERERHANQKKTSCPAGHSYAEHGAVRRRGDGSEFRVCKQCILEDTWKRRGGPSAKSQGIELHPVCPKCGGAWTYYGKQGRRKCTPCASAKQRERRAG